MRLNEISDNPKARKARKRVGRGIGSGTGKTAGKGHKGQLARSGVSLLGFEGGQMPLYRRLPKRGFTNIFRVENTPVNLTILEEFRAGSDVTVEKLLEAGVVRKKNSRVKILGTGELTKKLNVSAHAFSKSAIVKIEAAGGTATVVEMPKVAKAPKSAKSENSESAK